MEIIESFSGKYRFLSNFFPAPINADGLRYPTVEHAFQAAKTLDEDDRDRIRFAASPGEAKRLGRRVQLREDWEERKLALMEHLLRLKFQAPALRARLVETHPALIIEGNTWGDTYWGAVRTDNGWEGENHLGELLMKIREEIVG